MDWKIELVNIPVADVDRAKAFYVDQVGFNADHDYDIGGGVRFVQLTPPGSACSISIGTGLSDAPPGSVKGMQIVVADADAARAELVSRGVDASEVQDFPWGRFVFFNDPDGNSLLIPVLARPHRPRCSRFTTWSNGHHPNRHPTHDETRAGAKTSV